MMKGVERRGWRDGGEKGVRNEREKRGGHHYITCN